MARIAVTDGMDARAIQNLVEMGNEVIEKHYSKEELEKGALAKFDAVIVRSATKMTSEVIAASDALTFIGRGGVGVDNIDIEAATSHEIVVCNTPRASTHSVVELTIGHLLASCRHITRGDRGLRSGLWEKNYFEGQNFLGKDWVLLDLGELHRVLLIFLMRLVWNAMHMTPIYPKKLQNNSIVHSMMM